MSARIFQLNISPGGVPKLPIREAHVGELGLAGDDHAHPKHHGGPNRAVSIYSLELIQALQAEGHPIFPGSTGENVTTSGLPWAALDVGARLQLGDEVIVEITKFAPPCKIISASFSDENSKRIDQKLHPGESRVYARVERTGTIRIGQPITLL